MISAVMGIDPGVNGGVSVLTGDGGIAFVKGFKGKMTQKELIGVVRQAALVLTLAGSRNCFIEKVGFIKGDGGKGANTFGRVDGLLRGTALTLGLSVRDTSPMMWQSRLECMSGGNKNVTKKRAIELFGGQNVKITHAIADCLLIARYGQITLARASVRVDARPKLRPGRSDESGYQEGDNEYEE